MKLLTYNDVNMGVEKLHIYDIDIYGAETKKISRFKVEDEIFIYLDKYRDFLFSFYSAMDSFIGNSAFFFLFGEYGNELASSLREIIEINGKMEIVNKNEKSIISSILNNEELETIHLDNIFFLSSGFRKYFYI